MTLDQSRYADAHRSWRTRTIVLMDDRHPCVVPGCMVRSRKLDRYGVCPPHLHDLKHDEYVHRLVAAEEGHQLARRSA